MFKQDPQNANKGRDKGNELIRKSIQDCGIGRPILVDAENTIIAGNKTTAAADTIKTEEAVIVETDGSELVIVQREDLDIAKDGKARKLAVLDNRTAEVNLNWHSEQLRSIALGGDSSRIGFTSDELSSIETVSSGALTPAQGQCQRALRVTFGRYRFDISEEQLSEWAKVLEVEVASTGKTWQQIVAERLKL